MVGAIKYNESHKEVLDSLLLPFPGVSSGKMFGYPAYYVRGKMFACLYEDGVGIKVSEQSAKKLLERNDIIPFQPMGRRKMKEWVQLRKIGSEEYLEEKELFREAVQFVGALP